MNELENTKQWFEQAIPNPTPEQACIQVGCHYEEVSEMMHALGDDGESVRVEDLATEYKEAHEHLVSYLTITPSFKVELLDSLVDQIVTAVGVGHMMGMDVLGALSEVNRSNYSKFEGGKAVFDENGKIKKGKHYSPPNLKPFV